MGRYDEAMQWMERAMGIYVKALGPEHALASDVINNIGNVHWWRMEYQQALQFHQKAMDIRLKVYGAEHNAVANSHQNLGADNLGLGNLALARMHIQKCIELKTRLLGADHMQTLACRGDLGRLLLLEKKHDPAEAELDKVISIVSSTLGPSNVALSENLMVRADVALERKDPAKAAALYQRSLDIQTANHVENRFTVQTHMGLARALWANPDTRAQAVEHAHKAAEILSRFTGAKQEMLRELDAWLAQHTL